MRKFFVIIILVQVITLASAAELDFVLNFNWLDASMINSHLNDDTLSLSPLMSHGVTYSSTLGENVLYGRLSMGITTLGAFEKSEKHPGENFGSAYGGFNVRLTYPLLKIMRVGIIGESGCGFLWLSGNDQQFDSFISLEPGAYVSLSLLGFQLKVIGSYFFSIGGNNGIMLRDGFELKTSIGFKLPNG